MAHSPREKKEITFFHALIPVLSLLTIMISGLVIFPRVGFSSLPLEVIFILATIITVVELFYLGYSWDEIQTAMVQRVTQGLPALHILLCIGIVIGSWMVSGIIPMLIYYGIHIIHPTVIYFAAFFVPVIFSITTGTSWGSAGTIGVVIIGIASVIDANLAIVAGAVVGGAYFGDKLSPLSDTTNIAAIATGVDLYDHIRSMVNTTLPSAILASILYFFLGYIYPPAVVSIHDPNVQLTLSTLESVFNFNILLLLPIVVVIYGSVTRKPTVPTLLCSSVLAAILALIFQPFTIDAVVQSFYKGFHISMVTWLESVPDHTVSIFNRGGLYFLIEPITIAWLVFLFAGSMGIMNAMSIVVTRVFVFAKDRPSTIISSLFATGITNALTSNQFATCFLVADAFKPVYEKMRIPKRVLSRSIEDYGTMLEGMLPWTTTGLYMAATLGVAVSDYWNWQLLSLINFIVAIMLAVLGKGCFYHLVDQEYVSDEPSPDDYNAEILETERGAS